MSLPNGVHHLALATRDVKTQLDFFTEVIGMELVALYWMHGVENTVHAFVKMGETATIAFGDSRRTRHPGDLYAGGASAGRVAQERGPSSGVSVPSRALYVLESLARATLTPREGA
jgi:catechol 2,3-dioxygenase-like lactoylglutathione lyase family enzyme